MLSVAKHLAWRSNHGANNEAAKMLRYAQHDNRIFAPSFT